MSIAEPLQTRLTIWDYKGFGSHVARWWLSRDYEITAGCFALSEGGRVESYDPWASYADARWDRRHSVNGPVEELFEALRDAEIDDDTDLGALRADQLNPLLRWVRSYGLLGVALHGVESATVRGRDRVVSIDDDKSSGVLPGIYRFPTYVSFQRGRDGQSWFEQGRGIGPPFDLDFDLAYEVQSRSGLDVDHSLRTRVVRRDLDGQVVDATPSWFGCFFRDLAPDLRKLDWGEELFRKAESYPYPLPLSDDWWRDYVEPVEVFVHHAIELRRLRRATASGTTAEREKALSALNELTVGARRTVARDGDDGFVEVWSAPSLLSTLASMEVQDLVSNWVPRVCAKAGCGRVFSSGVKNQAYCRKECRWAAEKARQRAQEKSKPKAKKRKPRSRRGRKGRQA